MTCPSCFQVHGRDTNSPIVCPYCNETIGCFWHDQNLNHIRYCGKNPHRRVWDEMRCRICGWPLAKTRDEGCVPGDCSMRPRPTRRADGQQECARCYQVLDNVSPGYSVVAGGALVCANCLRPGEELLRAR